MILSNVFLSHIKKDIKKELKEPTTKQFTKIKILDFYTKNEIIMSKIIEKLNDYHQYFLVLEFLVLDFLV